MYDDRVHKNKHQQILLVYFKQYLFNIFEIFTVVKKGLYLLIHHFSLCIFFSPTKITAPELKYVKLYLL